MTKKYVAGVDPGNTGAICLYNPDHHIEHIEKGRGEVMVMFDMPLLEITRNGKKRNQIDLYALARFIDEWSPYISKAYIENPQGMPGMASNATYRLGLNCGIVQMAIASSFIPMELIAPATWKKSMGLGKDKDGSRLKASQIEPGCASQWARAKDDGRAEAFLLAYWGIKNKP